MESKKLLVGMIKFLIHIVIAVSAASIGWSWILGLTFPLWKVVVLYSTQLIAIYLLFLKTKDKDEKDRIKNLVDEVVAPRTIVVNEYKDLENWVIRDSSVEQSKRMASKGCIRTSKWIEVIE